VCALCKYITVFLSYFREFNRTTFICAVLKQLLFPPIRVIDEQGILFFRYLVFIILSYSPYYANHVTSCGAHLSGIAPSGSELLQSCVKIGQVVIWDLNSRSSENVADALTARPLDMLQYLHIKLNVIDKFVSQNL